MTKYFTNSDHKEYLIALKALGKYNRLAYKQLFFDVVPKLRDGILLGTTTDKKNYKVDLACDDKFKKIHGQVYLRYSVDRKTKVIQLLSIEPFDKLQQLYMRLVNVQDGVPIVTEADKFKAQLFKYMGAQKHEDK